MTQDKPTQIVKQRDVDEILRALEALGLLVEEDEPTDAEVVESAESCLSSRTERCCYSQGRSAWAQTGAPASGDEQVRRPARVETRIPGAWEARYAV